MLKKYKKVLINFTQVLLKAEIEFSQEQISTEKYRSISLKFCYSEQKKISARKKEVQKTTDQYISSFFKEVEVELKLEAHRASLFEISYDIIISTYRIPQFLIITLFVMFIIFSSFNFLTALQLKIFSKMIAKKLNYSNLPI